MKRLYLVGTTKDGKKLLFARTRGAKFGSMLVPITPTLSKLVADAESMRPTRAARTRTEPKPAAKPKPALAARRPAQKPRLEPAAGGASRTIPIPKPAEVVELPGGARVIRVSEGEFRRLTGLAHPEPAVDVPLREDPVDEPAAATPVDVPLPEDPVDVPVPSPEEAPPKAAKRATGRKPAAKAKRTKGKPTSEADAPATEPDEPPPPSPPPRKAVRSRLTPAQIQALLRQGRSARAVATLAGAPLEWVQRWLEPILSERAGVVSELKRSWFTKPRLGRSGVPVGAAIEENLRERGVAFPERVAADGWRVYRPEGGAWRLRYTYQHRGAGRSAQWEYDPATRTATARNRLATELSWRPPPGAGEAVPLPKRRPARRSAARESAGTSSSGRRSGGATPAARRAAGPVPGARRAAKRSAARTGRGR